MQAHRGVQAPRGVQAHRGVQAPREVQAHRGVQAHREVQAHRGVQAYLLPLEGTILTLNAPGLTLQPQRLLSSPNSHFPSSRQQGLAWRYGCSGTCTESWICL